MPRFKLILARKVRKGKCYRAIIQTSDTKSNLLDTISEFRNTVFKELREEKTELGTTFISDESRFELAIEPIE